MEKDKKKGVAAMIVAGLPKPISSSKPGVEDSSKDEMSDEAMAASDILEAISAKDASGLASALKDFVSMCESSSEEEPSEEEGY